MSIVFSITGLLAFFTGKTSMRSWPYKRKIEGQWVSTWGLVLLLIDLIPIFLVFLMTFAHNFPREIYDGIILTGIASLFCSPILNMIIYYMTFLLFSEPLDD